MLFQVEMAVRIPHDMPSEKSEKLKADERARAQELQQAGVWRHLWRHAGLYANTSIFDVESPQALHDILTGLPLFPFMDVAVKPLCRHPSSIHQDDR